MLKNYVSATLSGILFILCTPNSSAQSDPPQENYGEFFLCGGHTPIPIESIEFLGFFPSTGAAEKAASFMDEQKFEIGIRESAVGGSWSLLARYRALPSAEELSKDKAAMASLGRQHGADSLTPSCRWSASRDEG